MMPMVFCASFVPWPRLYAAALPNWATRNQRSTFIIVVLRNAHITPATNISPSTNPSSGASTMNSTVATTLAV